MTQARALVVGDAADEAIFSRILSRMGFAFDCVQAITTSDDCRLCAADIFFLGPTLSYAAAMSLVPLLRGRPATQTIPLVAVVKDLTADQACGLLSAGATEVIAASMMTEQLPSCVVSALCQFRARLPCAVPASLPVASCGTTYSISQAINQIYESIGRRNFPIPGLTSATTRPGVARSDLPPLVLTARSPSNGFYLLNGEIGNQNIVSAVGMVLVSDVFFAMCAKGCEVGEIAAEVERKLKSVSSALLPVPLLILEYHHAKKAVSLWNAMNAHICLLENGVAARSVEVAPRVPLGAGESGADWYGDVLPLGRAQALLILNDEAGRLVKGSRSGEKGPHDSIDLLIDIHREARESLVQLLTKIGARERIHDILSGVILPVPSDELLESSVRNDNLARTILPQTWGATLRFCSDTLRTVNPIPLLLNLIMQMQAPFASRERIFIVLSELVNNAIDHGVLYLDSNEKDLEAGLVRFAAERQNRLRSLEHGWVEVALSHRVVGDGGELAITVEDSGEGFDYRARQTKEPPGGSLGGRGILLVSAMCHRLTYVGNGNRVEAVIRWSPSGEE